MAIVDFAVRRSAKQAAKRAQLDAELAAWCRRVPRATIEAVLEAVSADSEEPLHRLPPGQRERCIAAFWQTKPRRPERAKIVKLGARQS